VLGNEMLRETNRRDCDHEFVCLDFQYSPKEFVMYFGVHLVATHSGAKCQRQQRHSSAFHR
jgi:hypothetical protein